jgi:hypothetical protein
VSPVTFAASSPVASVKAAMSRRCGGSARKSTRAWFRFRRRIRRVGPLRSRTAGVRIEPFPVARPLAHDRPNQSERAAHSRVAAPFGGDGRCVWELTRAMNVNSNRPMPQVALTGVECKPTDRGKSATAIHCGDALLVARALGVFENNFVRALERGQTCGRGIGPRGARRIVERGRNAFLALAWTSVDELPWRECSNSPRRVSV